MFLSVAPRVGAWIETDEPRRANPSARSHPVWVRGLKLAHRLGDGVAHRSHPVWVRGLKRFVNFTKDTFLGVAPRVGAWIETQNHLHH